jgi:type I restriction enzyme, S subunit
MRGDILISMTANVGRVSINTEDDCLLNQRVGKLEPLAVDPDLLFLLMSQRKFLASMAGVGSNRKGRASNEVSIRVLCKPLGRHVLSVTLAAMHDVNGSMRWLADAEAAAKRQT